MKRLLFLLAVVFASCVHTPSAAATRPSRLMDATVSLESALGRVFCSGVVLRSGKVLTADHCVDNVNGVWLRHKGRVYFADVEAHYPAQDLAVLLPLGNLSGGVALARRAPQPGDEIRAIGFPLGEYGKFMTRGVVSKADDRDGLVPGHHVFYHDAGIEGGNSGGPIFNAKGRVVGITSYGILTQIRCIMSCPGVYQSTHMNAATHLDELHRITR